MECNKIKCKCGSNKFLNKRQTIYILEIEQRIKTKADVRRKTRKEMKHIQYDTWKD